MLKQISAKGDINSTSPSTHALFDLDEDENQRMEFWK